VVVIVVGGGGIAVVVIAVAVTVGGGSRSTVLGDGDVVGGTPALAFVHQVQIVRRHLKL
jgi:hypothetical protein